MSSGPGPGVRPSRHRRVRISGPPFVFTSGGKEVVVYKARAEKVLDFMWDYPTCLNLGRRHPGVSDADVRARDLEAIGFDRQVLVPNNAPYAYDVDLELSASV